MSSLVDSKARLYASATGRVDILRCRGRRHGRGPVWQAPRSHFVFPLAGAFVWHVGKSELLCDPSLLLFAPAGSESAFAHPHGPETSLIVTPSRALVEYLAISSVDASAMRCHGSPPALQIAARDLRHAVDRGDDPVHIDEQIIDLTRAILNQRDEAPAVAGSARQTLDRTKAFLQARFTEPLSLADIAANVAVTPVYLTGLFRRAEGVALHQYLLKLRLAAGLERLPGCTDITDLALDLGFSSHSHFTAAFRKQFGTTPAAFRKRSAKPLSQCPPQVHSPPTWPLCAARGGVA